MRVNVPASEKGPTREYMVVFDEPQLDTDGDGPYSVAVIWEKYLRPLGEAGAVEASRASTGRAGRDDALRAVLEDPSSGDQIRP